MPVYEITFVKTTRETVEVEANSPEEAREKVYGSFGEEGCESIYYGVDAFDVRYVKHLPSR